MNRLKSYLKDNTYEESDKNEIELLRINTRLHPHATYYNPDEFNDKYSELSSDLKKHNNEFTMIQECLHCLKHEFKKLLGFYNVANDFPFSPEHLIVDDFKNSMNSLIVEEFQDIAPSISSDHPIPISYPDIVE